MTPPREEQSPWYRHFWPWFILVLLGTSVVGGIATVWIAVANQDALVSDEWYEDGKGINRRLERIEAARLHGVSATLSFAGSSGGVELVLAGHDLEPLASLRLEMSHPTQSERDQWVLLERSVDGAFRGRLAGEVSGRWYASIEPVATRGGEVPRLQWRLTETLHLPASEPIRVPGDSG